MKAKPLPTQDAVAKKLFAIIPSGQKLRNRCHNPKHKQYKDPMVARGSYY